MAKREGHLTERQEKWFASVKAGLERDTGRTLEDWIAVARTCPETKHRARVQWLKDHHGLGVNRASTVLAAAFPAEGGWDDPDALRAALWTDAGSRAIYAAVEAACAFDGVTEGARKGFAAFSRRVQFAAVKPAKGGAALLGLCVPADASPRLEPAGKEGWSERLKAKVRLASPAEVDGEVVAMLRRAYEAA